MFAAASLKDALDAVAAQWQQDTGKKAFPQDTHPPIIYPIALTAAATHPDAAAFLAYARSERAKPLCEAQGFSVLSAGRS